MRFVLFCFLSFLPMDVLGNATLHFRRMQLPNLIGSEMDHRRNTSNLVISIDSSGDHRPAGTSTMSGY